MHKLTLDQQEQLRSLLDNKDEMRLLNLVIEDIVVAMEASVNKVTITDTSTERELLYRRLKAEGARKLLTEIQKACKLK